MAAAVNQGLRVDQHEPLIDVPNPNLERAIEKTGQVYLYTAAAFGSTFLSAHLFAYTGLAGKFATLLMGANGMAVGIGLAAVGIALIAAIHFTQNSKIKHGFFALFSVYEGLVLSPLVLINTPVFAAAAVTTVGIVGGLGALALKMQTQFERFEKIMLVALGAIAVASLGAVFLSGVAAAFAHQVSLIGGFALFGAYVIYDTQKIRNEAALDVENFDVIKHSMNLYLDAVNLFVRIYEVFNKK